MKEFILTIARSQADLWTVIFSSQRDVKIFQLIEWIVMWNQSFAKIDAEIKMDILKLKPTSNKHHCCVITSMVPFREMDISQQPPSKFGLIFDS